MKRYQGIKVLVTGGTGFIGSRLVERLAFEEGAEVHVLVNNWAKATWVSRFPVTLIKGSINSVSDLIAAMYGCSIVFHCVGLGGSMAEAMKINVEGTKAVLEAAHRQGVDRVVYFSSAVVHGPVIVEGMNEDAPQKQTDDAYADSKIAAEKMFWEKTSDFGIQGVILRPTYVWGPNSQYYTIDFIRQMQAKNFVLVDEGKGNCNAVHVDNVVDVAILAGQHPKAINKSFLITDGEDLTWRQFYEYYANMVEFPLGKAISVNSKHNVWSKSAYALKYFLAQTRDILTTISNKLEPHARQPTRLIIKAPRKLVKMALKSIERRYPEITDWDLKAYSSTGRIDLSRLKNLLNYTPRKSVKQGMSECEIWLRDQNYIADSDR
ncbi:NAD-dependent epimerase/dehydratase family protein [Larkinella sp. GY13]|uniref:NAD-dependent epimerase/dehydratase family protein n=1 Tax=Larkinella sp. GY13 TaxID=3453720 RepID=UPI003EEC4732